ncbi:MAG: prepilin-type N-terminal cleavage/methylation domain-containing protein [Archangium sp.]|nr:prepilin-type N-terminal cleavage/methylation domain-containing protein [Archangium sp.]
MKRRGFTLIELAFVLAIITFLAAVTIPGYHLVWLRVQASEARGMLTALSHAESTWRRDHGTYLECVAGRDEDVPKGARLLPERACWKALGMSTSERSHYRYQVKLTPTGFEAIAEGDLDADGVTSRFSLQSNDLVIVSENDLE